MKNSLKTILCATLAAFACLGCQIRDYMVPLIVSGELDKMDSQREHRNTSVATVTRGDATREVHFTIDFAPPDNLRYDYADSAGAATTTLCVSTSRYELVDASSGRALRIVNLPPFSRNTFTEFRKYALRRALKENRAYVENAPGELGQTYWQLRTVPRENAADRFESISYITKDTKNNVRVVEKDGEGRIVSEFVTLNKNESISFFEGHFQPALPEGCAVFELDFASLPPLARENSLSGDIPKEHSGLNLVRVREDARSRIYDYTRRQMVFLYLEIAAEEAPLPIAPVSREVPGNDGAFYLNYTGSYTACFWRSGEWDRLVFTNLGPEIALEFARRIPAAPRLEPDMQTAE